MRLSVQVAPCENEEARCIARHVLNVFPQHREAVPFGREAAGDSRGIRCSRISERACGPSRIVRSDWRDARVSAKKLTALCKRNGVTQRGVYIV